MIRGSRRIVLLAAAIYLFVIFSGRLADRLILFPSTAPIHPSSALRRSIPFQNGELEVWTAASDRARQNNKMDAYILRFYGNADRAELWATLEAETWNDRAVEIWAVNYPGFGGSSGPAGLRRIHSAALAAFDAFAGEKRIINLPGAYHNSPIEGTIMADVYRGYDWLLPR